MLQPSFHLSLNVYFKPVKDLNLLFRLNNPKYINSKSKNPIKASKLRCFHIVKNMIFVNIKFLLIITLSVDTH